MTALDQAEAALLDALAAVRAARGDAPQPACTRRLMPLKLAAHVLGVSDKTARRRAQAGAGQLVNGKWLVDLDAAGRMGVGS